MANSDPRGRLVPSLIDRLTRLPADGAARSLRMSLGANSFIETVRQDLENLLNTRQPITPIPESHTEVSRSIANYGLPDLTAYGASDVAAREQLGRTLEKVLSQFEPRLSDIRVVLHPALDTDFQTVRFSISAKVRGESLPVAFETVLELDRGQTLIRSGQA